MQIPKTNCPFIFGVPLKIPVLGLIENAGLLAIGYDEVYGVVKITGLYGGGGACCGQFKGGDGQLLLEETGGLE
jgi:hypothetical protein